MQAVQIPKGLSLHPCHESWLLVWGWRVGLVIKSIHCSCRGPESSSQHLHLAFHDYL